jgi:hypothetical protein
MKNLNKIKIGIIAAFTLLLTSFMGCDTTGLQDSIDNFALVIGLEPINTGSTVLLTDAKTGELINATVTVTFAGENGTDVIDMYSDPITDVEVKDGILNFAISNLVEPTDASPATVKLRLEADGYLPATKTVEITEVGFSDFTFTMVDENNKPQSFKTIATMGVTASDGSTTAPIKIVSNSGTSGKDSTGIEIPEGTVFVDADGNPLTGNLSVEMSNFDLSDPIGVQNLPIDIQELVEEGEKVPTVVGISVLSVTNGQGKVATKVKNSIPGKTFFDIVLNLNGNTDIPAAKNVYSFGRPFEPNFSPVDTTNYTVRRQNFDTISYKIGFVNQTGLNTPLGIIITDNLGSSDKTYSNLVIEGNGYEGTLEYTLNSKGRSEKGSVIISNSPIQKDIVFNNLSETVSIDITSPLETTLTYPTLPEGDTFTITLPQKPATLIDSKINVVLRCTDPDERASVTGIPQSSLVYRKAGSSDKWKVIPKINWNYNEDEQVLTGGSVDIKNVEQGVDYNFKLSFDGNTENKVITISGSTVEVILSDEIDSICN